MTNSPDPFRYGLDRMIATGKRVFGWGWAAHATLAVEGVELRVAGDGWERRLHADVGLGRRDVADAFPALRNAASSGFIVTGFVPEGRRLTCVLQVRFDDGSTTEVDMSAALQTVERGERKRRQLAYVLKAMWRRLKRGDLLGIVRRARAQTYTAATLDDSGAIEQLARALLPFPATWIVFDHNMGGGANQYRRRLIEERVAAGDAVVFCTYNLPMLEHRLHVYTPQREERVYRVPSFLVLDALLADLPEVHIFVNSPVSFDEPLVLAEWLGSVKARHPRVRLTTTTHDYFAVCPSFVLLDADGRHCGIPSPQQCADCMARHRASYVSLSPPSPIPEWRRSWGQCLAAADEVRCFSPSSRRLLLKAYPDLDAKRVTVVPHEPHFFPQRAPRIDARRPLTIGVVGEISTQKGAAIVTELARIVERDTRDAGIVVLGTLEIPCSSRRLKVTGAYRREELPDLVEANGINMFLFPSVWPETFSYVVAELMAMHVPIVAFDLGAPGERVRDYPMGRVCAEVSARAAFEAMAAFHAELAGEQRTRVA